MIQVYKQGNQDLEDLNDIAFTDSFGKTAGTVSFELTRLQIIKVTVSLVDEPDISKTTYISYDTLKDEASKYVPMNKCTYAINMTLPIF